MAGCPTAAAAQVSALVRPVPAVGRPVAPPRRGQAGALVRAPELPRRARVVTVCLVRGRGARRGVQAVVLPVAYPAPRDAAAAQAGEGPLGADLAGVSPIEPSVAVLLVGVVEAVVGAVAHPLRQDAGRRVRALVQPSPSNIKDQI